MSDHLTVLEGDSALSVFRRQQLLRQLQALEPNIAGLGVHHLDLVASPKPLDEHTRDQLHLLLNGEPSRDPLTPPAQSFAPKTSASWAGKLLSAFRSEPAGPLGLGSSLEIMVAPRIGTVSPWSSKATDIANNCGLAVQRIERVTAYRLQFLEGHCPPLDGANASAQALSARWPVLESILALLFDPMTQTVILTREQLSSCFQTLEKSKTRSIDILSLIHI